MIIRIKCNKNRKMLNLFVFSTVLFNMINVRQKNKKYLFYFFMQVTIFPKYVKLMLKLVFEVTYHLLQFHTLWRNRVNCIVVIFNEIFSPGLDFIHFFQIILLHISYLVYECIHRANSTTLFY